MANDPQEHALRRLGRALKKLKGLVCLGIGLLLLVAWEYVFWQFYFASLSRGATADNPFQLFLLSLYIAGGTLLHPSVVTIFFATMFTLIVIGLYRLVGSLFEEEEEED